MADVTSGAGGSSCGRRHRLFLLKFSLKIFLTEILTEISSGVLYLGAFSLFFEISVRDISVTFQECR
ncbi:hypothetical protein [Pseudomonas fluorescens]|uniref:hypothetical protein n=1 Tax=Pseudomonas fluorescens TaxID=294 RepID=UPI0012400703|nr:hypothetical protein [Pseudomonas fluorescens]